MPNPSSEGPAGAHAKAQRNLTEGPITRTLLLFSLPLLGGNALQTLNLTANQFWVAHLLGVTAVTAIGNSNALSMLALGAIYGVAMAANILIAQFVGARDFGMVKRVMGTATSFFVVLSVVLSFMGWAFTPVVLRAMHTPASAELEAIIYLRIVFAAMPFMYFFQFVQMAQRGAGDSKTPFYFMMLAAGLDFVLNPVLVLAMKHYDAKDAIAGSAASTLIAQGLSLLFLLIHLYRRHSILMLRPSELGLLKPDLKIVRPLVMRGLPMSLQMILMSATGVVMIGFVNGFGAVTSAAFVGAQQIWMYIQMPGMAIGASVSSMAGQNVGAGRWDRVSKIAMAGLASSVVITGAIAVVIYLLGPLPLYLVLPTQDPVTHLLSPTIPIALHINQLVLWAFVVFNATFVFSAVVRSTGAVIPSLVILTISMLVIRVPFAWLLIPHLGADAIWWSFPLGTLTASALSALYYRFGGWRKVRMIEHPLGGEVADASVSAPIMDEVENLSLTEAELAMESPI